MILLFTKSNQTDSHVTIHRLTDRQPDKQVLLSWYTVTLKCMLYVCVCVCARARVHVSVCVCASSSPGNTTLKSNTISITIFRHRKRIDFFSSLARLVRHSEQAASYSDIHTPHTAIPTATWRQLCHKPSACSTTHTFCPHRGRCRQVDRPPASYKHRALVAQTGSVSIHPAACHSLLPNPATQSRR